MQNAFLSTCGQSTDAPHVSLLSHSLTWCEGHFVLPSTFACVAVSGGEVCLFCGSEIREEERDKKKPPCSLLSCLLVISICCYNHTPTSVAGNVLFNGAPPALTWPRQRGSQSRESPCLFCPITAFTPESLFYCWGLGRDDEECGWGSASLRVFTVSQLWKITSVITGFCNAC